jgi:hypothetical protein
MISISNSGKASTISPFGTHHQRCKKINGLIGFWNSTKLSKDEEDDICYLVSQAELRSVSVFRKVHSSKVEEFPPSGHWNWCHSGRLNFLLSNCNANWQL